LKSYDRFLVWLSYFDSELKRREGRRLPLHSCVRTPTLEELTEASRRLKLEPTPSVASFPRVPRRTSGYVSVKRSGSKQKIVLEIARELSKVRGAKNT
jgi:signal recognition particle subunit SRP19